MNGDREYSEEVLSELWELGTAVRAQRKARRVSPETLAALAGVPVEVIHFVERGEPAISWADYVAVLRSLADRPAPLADMARNPIQDRN